MAFSFLALASFSIGVPHEIKNHISLGCNANAEGTNSEEGKFR